MNVGLNGKEKISVLYIGLQASFLFLFFCKRPRASASMLQESVDGMAAS
jgi:hypothetical protein